MKRVVLGLLFVGAFLVTVISTLPMGFVLKQAGLERFGMVWAAAEGSLWKGRVSGVFVQGQAVGDITLKLRPASLFAGAPVYDVQWGGAAGRGSARVSLSRGAIMAEDARAQIQVAAFERLSPSIRAAGGTVRVSNGQVRISPEGCESGDGRISSDVITRMAQQYGRQFGPIDGRFSCQAREMRVQLTSESNTGEHVEIDARAGLKTGASVSALVNSEDRELTLALTQLGFEARDGGLRYEKEFEGIPQ